MATEEQKTKAKLIMIREAAALTRGADSEKPKGQQTLHPQSRRPRSTCLMKHP